MAEQNDQQSTIYVGGLDMKCTQAILHYAFEPFGEITEIVLPKPDLPSSTDPHRGFAYITFEEAPDAAEAIYNMDQSEMQGRVIKVSLAKPQKAANEGLGSKTAVWEQKEGFAARHAIEENSVVASHGSDPMQGLDQFDMAGPKAAAGPS